MFAPAAADINSVEGRIRYIWPQVAPKFARIWSVAEPPRES